MKMSDSRKFAFLAIAGAHLMSCSSGKLFLPAATRSGEMKDRSIFHLHVTRTGSPFAEDLTPVFVILQASFTGLFCIRDRLHFQKTDSGRTLSSDFSN
jgi:hypothetical protein